MNSQFLILFSVVKTKHEEAVFKFDKVDTSSPRKRKGKRKYYPLAQYQSPDQRIIVPIIRTEKSCSDRSNFSRNTDHMMITSFIN